jgi:hypothetical protein
MNSTFDGLMQHLGFHREKTMKVYIAGPMRGYPDYNFAAFHDAAQALRDTGAYEVISPSGGEDPDQQAEPIDDYMSEDVPMLEKCDAICLLDGWEQSEGSHIELSHAIEHGLKVYEYRPHNPMCMQLADMDYCCKILGVGVPTELSNSEVPQHDKIGQIINDRGRNYGHPKDDFTCVQRMYDAWLDKLVIDTHDKMSLATEEMMCVKHTVYMMLTKLARVARNPSHADNWDDIEGYSRCVKKCLFGG